MWPHRAASINAVKTSIFVLKIDLTVLESKQRVQTVGVAILDRLGT